MMEESGEQKKVSKTPAQVQNAGKFEDQINLQHLEELMKVFYVSQLRLLINVPHNLPIPNRKQMKTEVTA